MAEGGQWNALSVTGLCPSSTARDRFGSWVQDGFFSRFWQADLAEYDAFNGSGWNWLSMDGAMTKASLARGKTGPNPTDRAKCGIKRSLLVKAEGVPVGLSVAGANKNDFKLFAETIKGIPADRPCLRPAKRSTFAWTRAMTMRKCAPLGAAFGFVAHLRSRGEESWVPRC